MLGNKRENHEGWVGLHPLGSFVSAFIHSSLGKQPATPCSQCAHEIDELLDGQRLGP